jgi:proline dehydrogenase
MTITNNITFDDTSIAFSSKTNKELRKSYVLFALMDKNLIVKLGTIFIKAALKLKLPVKNLIKNNLFNHFCGGESISDSEKTIRELSKYHIGTILDYAVEGEKTEAGFNHTADEIIRTIHRSTNDPDIPFCVFKPTGMASIELLEKIQAGVRLSDVEEESFEKTRDRWNRVCSNSFNQDVRIFIDSEDSFIQDPIDDLAYGLMDKYNQKKAIVWNTYQMYRIGMLEKLEKAIQKAREKRYFMGAKLVRGAYMEKERERAEVMGYPDPIQPDKKATDRAYDAALELCVSNNDIVSVCSGSHNEQSNYYLAELMAKAGMKNDDERAFFAQLYGMSDHISYNLAKAGYNVVKYVPYGPVEAVVPYLLRRAEENTSISGQSSREFILIKKELKRRKMERKIAE